MSHIHPHLPLATYRFHYRAEEDFRLGADPRGLWHGVFGLHLREAACVVSATECRDCLRLHQCPYSYLFSGPRPPDSVLMRRYDTIPVPHIFHIPPDFPSRLHKGQGVSVDLVLAGAANRHLPTVIEAMARAGAQGLGPARGHLQLQGIDQSLPDLEWRRLGSVPGPLHAPLDPASPLLPAMPSVLRVHFLGPYKPSGRAAAAGGPAIAPFLMALVRRVSLLQYFYTGRLLEAPFEALKQTAEQVRPEAVALRRQRASRFAARHGKRLDTGGWVGHIDLPGIQVSPLWPYLYLGQWLNIGKNASMGYGQYRIQAAPSSDCAQADGR